MRVKRRFSRRCGTRIGGPVFGARSRAGARSNCGGSPKPAKHPSNATGFARFEPACSKHPCRWMACAGTVSESARNHLTSGRARAARRPGESETIIGSGRAFGGGGFVLNDQRATCRTSLPETGLPSTISCAFRTSVSGRTAETCGLIWPTSTSAAISWLSIWQMPGFHQ